jgi:predicted regulator of Ras-like GTPase activity (Roadblock/LC7/MglB family)
MASLDDILARLVQQVDGAMLAAIGSMDGLVVEQHPHSGPDLGAVAAELTHVLRGLNRAFGEHLDNGTPRELMVTTDRALGFVRVVTPDIYLLVTMNPSGNLGKARLYAGEAAERVLELLA